MANGAKVYTTASRTPCKGEVHRGGRGCDAGTLFSRRKDRVTPRHGRARGVRCVADVAAVRKSGAATRCSRRGPRSGGRRAVEDPEEPETCQVHLEQV